MTGDVGDGEDRVSCRDNTQVGHQGRERVVGDLSVWQHSSLRPGTTCRRWETDEADVGGPSSTRAPGRQRRRFSEQSESPEPVVAGWPALRSQAAAAAASRHEAPTGRQVREFTVCLSPHHGADRVSTMTSSASSPCCGYFPVQGSVAGTAMGMFKTSSRLAAPLVATRITSPPRPPLPPSGTGGFELSPRMEAQLLLPSPAIARRTAESTNVARTSPAASPDGHPLTRDARRLEPADGDDDDPTSSAGAEVDGAFNECEEGVVVTATHIDAG